MNKGSSRNGRKPKPRPKSKRNAAVARSLVDLKERLSQVADETAVLPLGVEDCREAESRINSAVSAMWAAEQRIEDAVNMLKASTM